MFRSICRLTFLVAAVAATAPLAAIEAPLDQAARTLTNDEWCVETLDRQHDHRESVCEVREFTLPAGSVGVETSNGGIRVTGSDRSDILVRAIVVARARTDADAREIMKQVRITTDQGRVEATGPRSNSWSNRSDWWVGFRLETPSTTDIRLRSSNGGLSVTGVKGRMSLRTSNGSISLTDIAGDVEADTSNGSVVATLEGTSWDGPGLEVTTSNGSVRLELPENYSAQLTARSSNGSLNVDFPVTVRGRIGREIETTLGSGGAPIKVRTSNGSVRVLRR